MQVICARVGKGSIKLVSHEVISKAELLVGVVTNKKFNELK